MITKKTEDELDLATQDFLKTYNSFRESALKLMAIIDNIRKNNSLEWTDLSEKASRTHEFLVQMMDESGRVREKSFGIKCIAEEKRK